MCAFLKNLFRVRCLEKITGLQIEENYLGEGSQGVVFVYGDYVAKLTRNFDEVYVAKWAMENSIDYLPTIYDIVAFPRNLRLIVREPLDTLIVSDQFHHLLASLEEISSKRTAKWECLRRITAGIEDSRIDQIVAMLEWFLKKKITVRDLFAYNFGTTRNGSLKLRDLGMISAVGVRNAT